MNELAWITLLLASLPASMVLVNLLCYRRPRLLSRRSAPRVSVLIPARNEEGSIRAAVESVLAHRGVELEVVVMDDHSEDRTAEIVRELAARDPRVRLERAPPLPPGWCGKQHACHALAQAARHPVLAFVDADVRIAPHGLREMVDFLEDSGADLVSGIPRQRTGTLLEKLVIPLIHFVLLGFLPVPIMRAKRGVSFAAGCGQLFVTRRDSYARAGGHAAIRGSRHDGITLPRAYRRAGLITDLFDATETASCRMYRGARELWNGFAKNATEGMAAPLAILPWTVLLIGGQVLPLVLLLAGLSGAAPTAVVGPAALACALGYTTRMLLAVRFRQSWLGTLLHPLGVLIVLAIQWHAWARWLTGREIAWKGRVPVES